MTTEEIEKAAEDYAERKRLEFDDCSFKDALKRDFKSGGDFVNKYWQEKTRWIPYPSKKLPEIGRDYLAKYSVLGDEKIEILTFRNTKELGQVFTKEVEIDGFLGIRILPVTHWKEIE